MRMRMCVKQEGPGKGSGLVRMFVRKLFLIKSTIAGVSLRLRLCLWRRFLGSSLVFRVPIRSFGRFRYSFQAYVHGLHDLPNKAVGQVQTLSMSGNKLLH